MRSPSDRGRTSIAGLLVANAVPLVGVVGFGWDLHSLLVIYWLESGVSGAVAVAKIRRAAGEDDVDELPPTTLADRVSGREIRSLVGASNERVERFFLSRYGALWCSMGSGVFLFPVLFAVEVAAPGVVALAGLCLAASHGTSYWVDFVEGGNAEQTGPVTQTIDPFRQVFVFVATFAYGGILVWVTGVPVSALVVMVLVKTVVDLRVHFREQERADRREDPAGH